MKQLKNQLPYNAIVAKAYYKTLRKVKQMLSSVEQEELRFTLVRKDKPSSNGYVVHEFVNPLLYLRLECASDNILCIHFGVEQVPGRNTLNEITSNFIRALYNATSKAVAGADIESAVRTDWLLNSCSDAYEYMEERNKHHVFKQLSYKVSAAKRKELLSVA